MWQRWFVTKYSLLLSLIIKILARDTFTTLPPNLMRPSDQLMVNEIWTEVNMFHFQDAHLKKNGHVSTPPSYSLGIEETRPILGYPGNSAGKEPACSAGDPGSIPGWEDICWRRDRLLTLVFLGFSGGSAGKHCAYNAEDLSSTPGLGRYPGERNGYPLQYSCLENPHGQRSLEGYNP